MIQGGHAKAGMAVLLFLKAVRRDDIMQVCASVILPDPVLAAGNTAYTMTGIFGKIPGICLSKGAVE